MIGRLHHLVIDCPYPDVLADFWSALLGQPVTYRSPDFVVVAPDTGFAKKARQWATRLHAPLAIADKRRVDHTETAEVVELIGDVEGCTALIVDDFTISGGTLIEMAIACKQHGARDIYAGISHGVLTKGTAARIAAPMMRARL